MTSGHEVQQRLRDPAGPAADVHDGGIGGDAREPDEHLRGPRALWRV